MLTLDPAGTVALEKLAESASAEDSGKLDQAGGVVEGKGLIAGTLALLAPRGAIVDKSAFPLLSARKRHAALRTGTHRCVRRGR